VTAFGYSGLLLGPAVLGFVAEHASLPVALVIPAVMAAVVTLTGSPAIRSLLRLSTAPAPAAVPSGVRSGDEPVPDGEPQPARD
jgi:hypothetical protein